MDVTEFIRQWQDGSEFILARTSGSTGVPKTIKMLKSDMAASARATNTRFGIKSDSTLFLPLSVDYIAGKMMAVRSLIAGCRLEAATPSNEFEFACERADLAAIVPSQIQWLAAHPEWSTRMKNVIVGGAPASASMRQALVDAGYNAFSTYGMTETCSHVAIAKIDTIEQPYQAMPGITFSIDSRGCLAINAPGFSFGSLVTNDVVDLIDEKTFYWRGRIDNVVNSGGVKIFPEELEKEYSKYTPSAFYIHGIPDTKWGEALELVIEGATAAEIEDTLRMLRTRIDHKLLPKSIKIVDKLPRTPNGKLKRQG